MLHFSTVSGGLMLCGGCAVTAECKIWDPSIEWEPMPVISTPTSEQQCVC